MGVGDLYVESELYMCYSINCIYIISELIFFKSEVLYSTDAVFSTINTLITTK